MFDLRGVLTNLSMNTVTIFIVGILMSMLFL